MYSGKINYRYLFFVALLAITQACVLFIELYNVIGGEELVNSSFNRGCLPGVLPGAAAG